MDTLSSLIIIGIILLICYFLFKKYLYKLFIKWGIIRQKYYLSNKIKAKADRKFKKLLNRFKKNHRRKPTYNELFRIVISASHITIRRRGKKGHWGRQKIRKYLLEKHHIVKNFKMR